MLARMIQLSKAILARGMVFLIASLPAFSIRTEAAGLPGADQRAGPPKTLNTLRSFPATKSRADWEERAREIREQILVSCGLWPMPEKTPLKARVFGRIERDGYSVEKVYFQTYPGFYLAGNLYRPRGSGKGPFPGVLNPHGHWREGRLADSSLGSIAARCISFARQGMIAFSYDMVGYNDTAQVTHQFASNPTNLLWNISLMGLQTWNSIRALDFLESLPEVDKSRLACTGESGGGTQTFMLGAIENRLAAQAPVVMVSHSMQGGCLCENAPGLRVDYSNMEIAAVPAPRPQILVAAAGDWTRDTPIIEGPALQGVYRLFRSEDKLRYTRFDFDHNYNQTSREAVYEWFGRWLLHHPNPSALKEAAYRKEADADLAVWPDKKLPADALNEAQLAGALVKLAQAQLQSLKPTDKASREHYNEVMLPAWRHTLHVDMPGNDALVESGASRKIEGFTATKLFLGRPGKGDRLPVVRFTPAKGGHTVAVLVHPQGKSFYMDDATAPRGLARQLLNRNYSVILVDTFLTGELASDAASQARKPLANFFCTYNRTDLQERVQDLITTCAFARRQEKVRRVVLCGSGRAGLWSLMAAPAADAVVADCDSIDLSNDTALMAGDLFAPGLRKLGAFEGVATLAAPNPLLLHNRASGFPIDWIRQVYINRPKKLRHTADRLNDEQIRDWLLQMER